MCEPGSKRELIKSTLPNDLAFGYLCQNSNSTTLGLYRFEVKDDAETKLKAIVLTQVWVTDIAQADLAGEIQSVILTRSMSQRIKLILATSDRIAIVNAKEGKIEAQLEMDAEIDRTAPVKLFSIP